MDDYGSRIPKYNVYMKVLKSFITELLHTVHYLHFHHKSIKYVTLYKNFAALTMRTGSPDQDQ
jgi:hypothetical protein